MPEQSKAKKKNNFFFNSWSTGWLDTKKKGSMSNAIADGLKHEENTIYTVEKTLQNFSSAKARPARVKIWHYQTFSMVSLCFVC